MVAVRGESFSLRPRDFQLCRKHGAGFPMQGLGKKILPVEKRKVEIFLDQLAKPLQGAKRLLRQRGSEHRFPALTLALGSEHCVGAGTKITRYLKMPSSH